MRFSGLTAALLLTMAAPALADGIGAPVSEPEIVPIPQIAAPSGNQLRFTAGAGLSAAPGYFGSDETVVGPTGSFSFEYLRYGNREFGSRALNTVPTGLSFGGSFRYIADRAASDYPELAGLSDLDLSLEVGAGVTYYQPNYEVFADLRYGVLGHEALVGEVGMDLILRPSDAVTLSAGPRVFWGSDDYADTYFSVDGSTAGLDDYQAGGGILSAGVEVGAEYQFNDTWGLEGSVRWDRYIGDAADSPLVQNGSEDAVSARVVATRRFTLDF